MYELLNKQIFRFVNKNLFCQIDKHSLITLNSNFYTKHYFQNNLRDRINFSFVQKSEILTKCFTVILNTSGCYSCYFILMF